MLSRKVMSGGAPPDPYFENVALLLHGDGTNGGQNNTFIDGSTNNFTITRNGNTTQGSFNPYGTLWSNYFDGTDDYLSVADNVNLRPGAGAFTIEAWIYRNAAGAAHTIFAKGGASTGVVFQVTSSNTLQFTHTTTNITSTGTIAASTWTHVAVVREGTGTNQTKLYINGTADGQGTVSTDFTQTEEVRIGTDRGATGDFAGYISNLRLVKGTAVYTGNFTPSGSPLTAISNTSLLTCQSNRFLDNSTNNFAITRNGDVKVTSFAPFAPSRAYDSGLGASGYFPLGGNITVASQAALGAGTGDFTLECWVYYTTAPDNSYTLFLFNSSNNYYAALEVRGGLLQVHTFTGTHGDSSFGPSFILNQWNHIAMSRVSGVLYGFINGNRGANSVSFNTDLGANGYLQVSSSTGEPRQVGWITDVRYTIGSAVYNSATYTVPTAPLGLVTNTKFLCNFKNAAIFDSAAKNDLETVGNAQIDTTTKKFGTGSLEFDGTGDWLLLPDNPDLQLGTGNLTVEFWVYLATGDTGSNRGLVSKGTASTGWSVSLNTTQKVVFSYASSTITSSGAVTLDAWNHIAVVREGTGSNQTKIYIGGTNDGTGTVSTDFNQTNVMYVGANRAAGDPMKGFIDDLRITKGVARYTANFTPLARPFPDK